MRSGPMRRPREPGAGGGGLRIIGDWALDADVAAFYQSFIEVRVEPTKGRVRLLRYGVHGRLHWGRWGYRLARALPTP